MLFLFCFSLYSQKQADEINNVANGIKEYYMWPLIALGVPGNMLTIITLVTMGKMTPGAFFIAVLAVSDLAALVTKFIDLQNKLHKVYLGPTGCKMTFLPIYFSTLANWTLALIALERFIAVCYPLQRAYLFTKRRSYIAVGVLSVTFLLFLAPLTAVIISSTEDGHGCGPHADYRFFWTKVWYWINASLVIFIPFILCLLFTIFIIRGLQRYRRERRSLMKKESDSASNPNSRMLKEAEKTERMLTIMLILTTVIFLLLALPACIYFLAKKEEYDDNLEDARWYLFSKIQFMLFDSSHAVNFFLYFLSARRFRTHLIKLLTCRRKSTGKHAEISNQTDSSVLSSQQKNTATSNI